MEKLTRDDPADYNLEIKPSGEMGNGVFTLQSIKKGSLICPYVYEKNDIMTIKDYRLKHGKCNLYTYRNMRKHMMINVKNNRNVITYINERKDTPNVYLKSYKLYALEDINEKDELFLKYWYKTNF